MLRCAQNRFTELCDKTERERAKCVTENMCYRLEMILEEARHLIDWNGQERVRDV